VNRALRFTLHGLAVVVVSVLAVFSGSARAHPGSLHIHKLRASVSSANGIQMVRIKAQVCLRSNAEALNSYPDELRLTQFFIYKSEWRPLRVLIDPNPQWLVPLGETWGGRACGWLRFEDLWKHPEGFAGFGSSINCVGVAFSIKVHDRRASKRTTIRCGSK
jgi:hypothetical protein